MKKLLKMVGVLALLAAISTVGRAQVLYTVQNIGNFMPTGINSKGEVAGYGWATVSGPDHSYLYSNGTTLDLGTFGGAGSRALGINDNGQVVGFIEGSGGSTYHAFVYQNGSVTDMNSLIDPSRGLTLLGAEAINNKGQIAGICRTASGEEHVFLYDHGTVSDWNVPGALELKGLNDAGKIIGNYNPTPAENHGFLLRNGVFTDIAAPNATVSGVCAINSKGTILGGFAEADGTVGSFTYEDGQFVRIGNDQFTTAFGLNDVGQIVGTSTSNTGFLYDDGKFVDVDALISPDLGLTLGWAYCINNNAQIVASGRFQDDTLGRMFLLSPVPEPASLVMIAMAIISAILRRFMSRRLQNEIS